MAQRLDQPGHEGVVAAAIAEFLDLGEQIDRMLPGQVGDVGLHAVAILAVTVDAQEGGTLAGGERLRVAAGLLHPGFVFRGGIGAAAVFTGAARLVPAVRLSARARVVRCCLNMMLILCVLALRRLVRPPRPVPTGA